MRAVNNSNTAAYLAKQAELGLLEYSVRVATPVMQAIDAMPAAYRALVNDFGYVDVYRAWRAGWSPELIRAASRDGVFVL